MQNNDKNFIVEVLLKEYSEVMSEISDYQKNGLQLTYIFLGFIPLATVFALENYSWLFNYLQITTLIFLALVITIDNNIMMDSARAIVIEKQINDLLGGKFILWQQLVGSVEISLEKKEKFFNFYFAPSIILVFFFLFYFFFSWQASYAQQFINNRNIYVIFSTLLYFIIFFLVVRSRGIRVKRILSMQRSLLE